MSVISEAPVPDVLEALRLVLSRVTARRVLEIGTGDGDLGLVVALALPVDGMLITLDRDEATARRARQRFAAAGVADKVSVIIGDASRYLHKVAGPFDLIVRDGNAALLPPMLDRLVTLLRSGGALVTVNVNRAGDYNKTLAGDSRLSSTFLATGNGVVISVKQDAT